MNLPNAITLARIISVPLIVWLILKHELLLAFWVFVAAGVSDALDGFIAKRFGMESRLGSYLDPIADKLLLVSVYVTLGYQGYLADWVVILVVFRDVLILGGAALFEALTHALTIEPLMTSKVNTASQIVLAASVLGGMGMNLEIDYIITGLTWLVGVTTVMSGLMYLKIWMWRLNQAEDRE